MSRRLLILFPTLCCFALACGNTHAPASASDANSTASAQPVEIADDLLLRKIAPGVWLHASLKQIPGAGAVSSNGLVVIGRSGTLLVDTPWTRAQTQRLLAWLRDTHAPPVREVILTHAHEDRLGGIAEIPPGVRIHALAATSELAARDGHGFVATPLRTEDSPKLVGESVETYFPGAAHAPDNIVVWFPGKRILFGGCMIRSASSEDLGNLADADVPSWRASIQRVIARYPSPTTVVPGHGPTGGKELLLHTRDLVERRLKSAPGATP